MTLWMVRGDKYGQYNSLALENGFVYHASKVSNLEKASRKVIFELVRDYNPDAKEAQIRSWAAQLYAMAHGIQKDDLVAMPLKNSPQIAIGRVIGPYYYRTDLGDIHHTIPVEWLKEDIPRTAFGQDLLYSLGSARTVCQVKRNNAEQRVIDILKGNKDPGLVIKEEKGGVAEIIEAEEEGPSDVQELAQDQIRSHLQQNFKGHNLARLVEAVLKTEGYVTKLSSPGPDGGVDILASKGSLGLEGPRLCVQVKSSESSSDVNILRTLQGTMQTFKADQGLLVSWGGYKKSVENEARLSFFSVRLWDADDLVEAVLRNYDRLPEELKSELPLKRIWALVLED
jgi:restriction system protein